MADIHTLSISAREGTLTKPCDSPLITKDGLASCRKCEACLKRRRRHWLGRLAAESYTATVTRFVTLTYDDDHVDTALSLPREHVKQWLRNLRSKGYVFKHKTVGEYGDETKRPHWHSMMFFHGKIPDFPLDVNLRQAGWSRGKCQFEKPRSIAGATAYLYDYIHKGGLELRPSPGMALTYLLRWARVQAHNRLLLANEYAIRYNVPGVRDKRGKLWEYHISFSHPYAILMAEEYLRHWDYSRGDPNYIQFWRIDYDG